MMSVFPSSPSGRAVSVFWARSVGAVLLAAGLLLSCTSDSPPEAAADSTAAPDDSAVSAGPSLTRSSPPAELTSEDTRSVAEKLADTRLETRVKQALTRDRRLHSFLFRPTVVRGHLVLRGDVNTPDQYRRAERVADQVDGVSAVTNQLTMEGRPVTEERLTDAETTSDTDDEDASVYHTVQPGDTMWEIARQYRSSVDQIRRLNDLRSSGLKPGERIRVR